jgi:Nidogen-like
VFPGPCPSLPAGRMFDLQENSNNDGWTLVDFCLEGSTGSGPANAPDCHYNDDDSSSEILQFSFVLFGDQKTKVYINTNGNLSFDDLYETYTSTGFPVSGYPMVAPFWADVDTRGPHGHIWRMQVSAHTFAIAWDNVGYYFEQGDKRNTFQVMISDGSDSNMGSGNNVCFCYADIEWTTGEASNGSGGFGGFPATVGVNKGDGENYLQIGLYNAPGTGAMGVDVLDGFHTCFSLSAEHGNVPPVPVGFPQGPIDLPCDASITDLRLSFTAPENTQITYLGVVGLPVGMSVDITDGEVEAVAILNWSPTSAASVTLTFTAIDDGDPVGQTDVELQMSYPGPCNTPPVAVCTDVTVSAEGPDCKAYATIDGGSYDTHGETIQLEQQPEGPYSLGSTNVILTVADQGGATDACTATITVVDTTGPTAVCEENVVIHLDASGIVQLDAFQVDAGSWDDCGVVVSTFNDSFSVNAISSSTIVLRLIATIIDLVRACWSNRLPSPVTTLVKTR